MGRPRAARRGRLGDRAGGRCSGSRSRSWLGFAFAIVLHLSDTLRRAFYPLLVASQTVPVIAIAPILVVWLGFGIGPKLAIIALVCFFPITVNTLDGLRSVDPDLPRMMRTLDAGRSADPAPGRGPVGAAVPAQRREDRRRDLGDRRRVRRVGGRRRGPRPPDPDRPGAAADGAGVRRRGRALGARADPLRRPGAGRAPVRLVERRAGSRGPRREAGALALALLAAALGGRLRREAGEPRSGDAEPLDPGARLLRQPRPRRDLHGARARLLRRGRARGRAAGALRPLGADPPGRRRARRPRDLLRARGAARPATRACRWSRSRRSSRGR